MKSRWLVKRTLVAAIAALPLMSLHRAYGQYPAGQSGQALDANPRVGSGGVNPTNSPQLQNSGVTGNRIVTGNVTGGQGFRGGVPYTDPREFRGNVAGSNVDNFIRDSSGSGGVYQAPRAAWQTEGFYGSARLAEPPPPGFAERGLTGTYTPAGQPARPQPREGTTGPLGTSSFLYTPGSSDLLLQGPLDPVTNQPTFLTASPLLGLRQWNAGQLPDWGSLSGTGNNNPNSLQPQNPLDRLRMDPRSIQQMREELYKSSGEGTGGQRPGDANEPSTSGNLAKPLPRPFDAPENTSLSGRPLDSSVGSTAIVGQVRPDQSIGDRLAVPPTQQSSQYAELQRRLDRYYTSRLETDEERHRDFLKQLRAKEAADKAGAKVPTDTEPGPGTTGQQGITLPGQGATGRGVGLPDYAKIGQELLTVPPRTGVRGAQTQPVNKPQPVQVASLAEGVKAQGLANVLRNAEDLMKQGKYLSALDQYMLAERVAPNNPLVWLGRAHSEVAGAYYRRAEQDLRQALTRDPTLMMGQYDLKVMIGQERLETLVKDLKDVAKRQEKDPGPVFLLAYLAYNTGSQSSAAMYLDEAEKRAGGKDNFYRLVRSHWTLGGEQTGGGVGAVSTMALSDVLKQFEEGNVLSATLNKTELSGAFRNAVSAEGGKAAMKTFRTQLPAGAASGPLGKWIQEHRQGAEVKIETGEATTQPSK